MIKTTIRIDEYTYSKIKLLAKYFHQTINQTMVDLIKTGYCEEEKRIK